MPILPFKLNQDRRRRNPKQKHKVMNSLGALLRSRRAYDASLRQRGSLTVRFTAKAIEAWLLERGSAIAMVSAVVGAAPVGCVRQVRLQA